MFSPLKGQQKDQGLLIQIAAVLPNQMEQLRGSHLSQITTLYDFIKQKIYTLYGFIS